MPRQSKLELVSASCKDCGRVFEITPEEQLHFKSLGFALPKRCPACRKVRRDARKAEAEKEKARLSAIEKARKQKKREEEEAELEGLLKVCPFYQTSVTDLVLKNPSKTLVIIGNGFDIMHGVKSSYWDFQKTLGKNSMLRFYLETYLDTKDLWSNLEEALGRMNYSIFLNPDIINMWLEDFGAYDPDAQAADFFGAVETAIQPAFEIPRELNRRFQQWVRTLTVEGTLRPFISMLHGDYKVLCFNYTEFIESLYGAKEDHICYIHGCRKKRRGRKSDELILGHKPGTEEEQWDKVQLKPYKFKDPYKRYIMESALETAARETAWYDEATTKKCADIIESHAQFFDDLPGTEEIYVIGHSLSEVDYPYFQEVVKKTEAAWYIGYHSLDDMKRLMTFTGAMGLDKVTVFRT